MKMEVYFGDKTLNLSRYSNFIELKKQILKEYGRLVKYFLFKEKKINEYWKVKDFPQFLIVMDPNNYKEYKKGNYRCSSCFKYLKYSNWVCRHTPKCRAKYLFFNNNLDKVEGGYKEQSPEEYCDELFERAKEKEKQRMQNRINELLGFK